MRNLFPRLERYFKKDKPKKWHIDYLLASVHANIIKVEFFPSEKREECLKNQEILSLPGAWIPVIGFGSSDCSKCPAHLIAIKKYY